MVIKSTGKESSRMKRFAPYFTAAMVSSSVLLLAACGGGGGSSSNDPTAARTGYQLPSEISAVPAEDTSARLAQKGGSSFGASMRSLARAVSDLSADSDYKKAQTRKYVEERSLEQFDIIEEVMSAIGQTNYADSSVVDQGPYTAMVTWVEDEDGREIKTLQPWVVDSSMISQNGQDVNQVRAWIEEPDEDNPGQTELIKAEFLIYAPATVNADGSYADYGDWDLNVTFDDTGTDYFVATSRVTNGVTTLMLHERFNEDHGGGSFVYEVKGVLNRGATSGYGKVAYPDWSSCQSPSCEPSVANAEYAYNADFLAVQVDGDSSPTYKERDPAKAVEMTHRYGLFHAVADGSIAAGDNVEKHRSFGFPLRFTDNNSLSRHAYYGAWQGRHEIWGARDENGSLLSAGDAVTRDDRGDNQSAQTYVVSPLFKGTLTKRTLVEGALSDIQNIPVETWINKHYDITWNGSEWQTCNGWIDWNSGDCRDFETGNIIDKTLFDSFDSLVFSEGDRKHVNIGGWDQSLNDGNGGHVDYVYLKSDPGTVDWSGAGFYPAEYGGEHGQLIVINGSPRFSPSNGNNLWINIGGSIYIEYTGSGWVQKNLVSFDQETWTPTFDSNDSPFDPELGREYYINNKGASFVVKRVDSTDIDATDYEVMIELQSAANPKNVASILPASTSYLATPWRPEVKFTLETNAASQNFLKLIYVADDPNTQDVDEAGTVSTNGEWGLHAYDVSGNPLDANDSAVAVDGHGIPTGNDRPVQFNWEYSEQGWGSQQFLCSPDCSAPANYLTLSDPVQLQPITLTNGAGASKTLSLQFDGWMHGMPDLYHELHKNNFQMTQAISDKVINIPAGTEMTDVDGVAYYVKPLEVSVFLNVVGAGTPGLPDINQADSADLNDVPGYTDHGMGAKPGNTQVLFSEGLPVTQ